MYNKVWSGINYIKQNMHNMTACLKCVNEINGQANICQQVFQSTMNWQERHCIYNKG